MVVTLPFTGNIGVQNFNEDILGMIVNMWHTGMLVWRVLQKAGLSYTTYYREVGNGAASYI
jgi:hypothetical protein